MFYLPTIELSLQSTTAITGALAFAGFFHSPHDIRDAQCCAFGFIFTIGCFSIMPPGLSFPLFNLTLPRIFLPFFAISNAVRLISSFDARRRCQLIFRAYLNAA